MSMESTPTAKNVVDRFRALRQAGGGDEAFDLFAPDVTIDEPPLLPYGGRYIGRSGYEQLLENIFTQFDVAADWTTFDAGDFSCAVIVGTFTSKATGRSTPVRIVENYYVTDGRITAIDIFYKNPDAVLGLLN